MSQPSQKNPSEERVHKRRRLRTVRDLLVFQGKILVEGVKDIVLIPAGIVAAILDIVYANKQPDRHLDRLLRYGKQFEDWLDLYNIDDTRLIPDPLDESSVDGDRDDDRSGPSDASL